MNNHSFNLSIIESSFSDHKQLYLEIGKLAPEINKENRYTAINYEQLYKCMSETITNSNHDYCDLEESIIESLQRCKTEKNKKLNPPQKDWINKNIIDSINNRNRLWRETKVNPENEDLKRSFTEEQLKVKTMIKTSKEKYYHKLFYETSNQPKKMWELINTLAINKVKNNTVPPSIISDSGLISDGTEVCNQINSFFSSIGMELASKIPLKYHNDTSNILMFGNSYSHEITLNEFRPCSVEEVNLIIDNLDANASTGIDGISTKAIKCIKTLIARDLVNSINKCLKLGAFPDSLKFAKVSPIYKSGVKHNPSNYRPVSVLPVMSKIFERVLDKKIKTEIGCKLKLRDFMSKYCQKNC
ncbi:hypothetical protein ABMA27_001909 [Loxostege sticticalis]|uniref:Reverse transcriptase domain-containing protein n=1 Tax=Loxostege sticticalis TaxID=481309 RepID=A0ABR3HVV4_LOXSC